MKAINIKAFDARVEQYLKFLGAGDRVALGKCNLCNAVGGEGVACSGCVLGTMRAHHPDAAPCQTVQYAKCRDSLCPLQEAVAWEQGLARLVEMTEHVARRVRNGEVRL